MRYVACTVLLLFAFRVPVSGQDKAKVKCGPADVDRVLFKEAATVHILTRVPCGEELEVMEDVSTSNSYKVQRGNGQLGYLLGDAIDASGLHLGSASASASASEKPLTNADITGMLDAGLSQEIVVAKIKASSCAFDTTPATLKTLKTKGVPDSVVVAMVQAPAIHDAEPKASASTSASESTEAKQAAAKRQAAQAANDEFEDCRIRAQNEYDAKMNAMGTMALSPMMRVVGANKLKQNLDSEVRQCRAQYEARLQAIEAK